MNLSHYVLLKSFFVTARVVWAEIFTEVERVFLRRNFSTIYTLVFKNLVFINNMIADISCSCVADSA